MQGLFITVSRSIPSTEEAFTMYIVLEIEMCGIKDQGGFYLGKLNALGLE